LSLPDLDGMAVQAPGVVGLTTWVNFQRAE
jgi:hypothetical protein